MTLRQYYRVREQSWIGTGESPHPSSPNLMLDVRLVRSILPSSTIALLGLWGIVNFPQML